MNFVEIIGNVANEPEQRVTASGVKMTSFSVADNQKKGDKEDVIWWRVVVWDGELSRILPYVKKGSRVVVYGTMRKPRTYNDSSGNVQVSMEIRACMIRFLPASKSEVSQEVTKQSQESSLENISYGSEASNNNFVSGESSLGDQLEEHFSEGISPF